MEVERRTAARPRRLRLARYASGADGTGCPRPLATHRYPGLVVEPSRSEARLRQWYCSRSIVLSGASPHPRGWECLCVPMRCGYAPVWIAPCGLVVSFSLTVC